jgi:hypothetical protein
VSEADARFEEALRADPQRHLGGSLSVRRLSLRSIADGGVEIIAVVRADDFDLRFRATGETAVEAYGRLVADGHPERVPRGERTL